MRRTHKFTPTRSRNEHKGRRALILLLSILMAFGIGLLASSILGLEFPYRKIQESQAVPCERKSVFDANLEQGKSEIRQKCIDGVKDVTYRITGSEKKHVSETVTVSPTPEITARGTRLPLPLNLPAPFVVHPGGSAWLQAGTRPGSVCSIVVNYLSGPSRAQGLYQKTANSEGEVRWDWFIGTNTTPGRWPVDVNCTYGGQSASGRAYIDVSY